MPQPAMSDRERRLLPLALLVASACAGTTRTAFVPIQDPPSPASDPIARAFATLVAAEHWRERKAARDALADLGEEALEQILVGTAHEEEEVRRACHEILRADFPTREQAVDAIVRGLGDESRLWIAYPSAFHLGEHRIVRAREALEACLADEATDERTRWAAAKSLGELGVREIMVTLWNGLGSDDAYERYLANLGVKGLTGKDLAAFGYEGAWEGAFVSGPAVGRVQGQPIEKAEKRMRRWQAIVAFTKWLRADRPELFRELEEKLW